MDKVGVYNPLNTDFTVRYANGSSFPQEYTAKAGDITFFDSTIAEHVKKHLVDELLNRNWPKDGNVEIARERLRKQVSVDNG